MDVQVRNPIHDPARGIGSAIRVKVDHQDALVADRFPSRLGAWPIDLESQAKLYLDGSKTLFNRRKDILFESFDLKIGSYVSGRRVRANHIPSPATQQTAHGHV